MKKGLLSVVLILAIASPSWAGDIAGKWGIGAGVFGGGGEVSLIRGHSQRTAWLLDIAISGSNSDVRVQYTAPSGTALESNRNFVSVAAGPGLRRYSRPLHEFSPYFDLSVRGMYQRFHETNSPTRVGVGARFGLGLGLEYFTRWHFSVAAHAPVANLSWTRNRTSSGNGAFVERNGEIRAAIAVRPSLYVRGYF